MRVTDTVTQETICQCTKVVYSVNFILSFFSSQYSLEFGSANSRVCFWVKFLICWTHELFPTFLKHIFQCTCAFRLKFIARRFFSWNSGSRMLPHVGFQWSLSLINIREYLWKFKLYWNFYIHKLFTYALSTHSFLTQLSDSCEKFAYVYLRWYVFNARELLGETILYIWTSMAVGF